MFSQRRSHSSSRSPSPEPRRRSCRSSLGYDTDSCDSYDSDYSYASECSTSIGSVDVEYDRPCKRKVLDNIEDYSQLRASLGDRSEVEGRNYRRERSYSDVRSRGEAVREAIKYGDLKLRVVDSSLNGTNKQYVEYALEVDTGSHQWTVWYRYSDWRAFDEDLACMDKCGFMASRHSALGVFPKKRWNSTSPEARRERVKMFDEYVNTLAEDEDIRLESLFVRFLCENSRISVN